MQTDRSVSDRTILLISTDVLIVMIFEKTIVNQPIPNLPDVAKRDDRHVIDYM